MLDKVIHGEGVPHCNGWVAYLSGTKNIPTDRRLGSDVSMGSDQGPAGGRTTYTAGTAWRTSGTMKTAWPEMWARDP